MGSGAGASCFPPCTLTSPARAQRQAAPAADVEGQSWHRKVFSFPLPTWKAASQRYQPADQRQVSHL